MTAAELPLRAMYCRDLARRTRLQIDALARSDAEMELLAGYLDALNAEALTFEKPAVRSDIN